MNENRVENAEWFEVIIGVLCKFETLNELRTYLENEGKKIESQLVEGPLGSELIRHLYGQIDPLTLVLRAHLYLEYFLDAVLTKKFKHSPIIFQNRGFSFSIKLDVLRAANYIDEQMYKDIILLNRLRNKFAHNLFYDIGEFDMSSFTYCSGLETAPIAFSGSEANKFINIFMFRQIIFHLLIRMTVRHSFISDVPVPT